VACVPGVSPGGRGSYATDRNPGGGTPHSFTFGLAMSRPEPRTPFSSPQFHSYIGCGKLAGNQ